MELGKRQKRRHGEVIITIDGRMRPVTIIDVMDPRQMIDVYERISAYNVDEDCIKIF